MSDQVYEGEWRWGCGVDVTRRDEMRRERDYGRDCRWRERGSKETGELDEGRERSGQLMRRNETLRMPQAPGGGESRHLDMPELNRILLTRNKA